VRVVTFVLDGTVGIRRYKPGDSANLPEAFVRALLRRGLVIEGSSAPVAAPQEASPLAGREDSTMPVEGRGSMSKRALRKLLRRKATT
jgi:hypothetical protein